MLKIVNKEKEGYLSKKDIDTIDCDFLHKIDELWMKYSEGYFGFSVQKEIWDEICQNCNGDDEKAEEEFAIYKVPWCDRYEDHLKCDRDEIQPEKYFNNQIKVKGYLPTPPPMTRDENEIQVWVIDAIAEKLKECKKNRGVS